MDFDRTVFAPAFIAAGLWVPIRVTTQTSPPVDTDCYAGFRRPDVPRLASGALSTEYEIRYQHADLPVLAENDTVKLLDANGDPIAGELYRVRQSPFVTDDPGDDQSGYFRIALLTKINVDLIEAREDAGHELRE